MPRAKVDPRFRRRVAHACESCKKRKAKCNGVLPCDQCKARHVEDACRYSRDPRPGSRDDKSRSEMGDKASSVARSPSPKSVDVPVSDSCPTSKDSQMLKDSKGKFIYAGESATLSYLEAVRNAVQIAVGPCAFTNEPARIPMIENTPKIRFETCKEPLLDHATAQCLASEYFLATSGILDLFDPPWLAEQVSNWAEKPLERSKASSAVIYLALAIGAQGRGQNDADEVLAEQCFAYGRQLTMFNLLDDPSLTTIQAILLISYYMLSAFQHNAAFINLGVATRAAYTLGIHLHETNTAFGGEEGLSRERAWKSLRVCDLFLAATLGRPPATSESVSNIAWAPIKALPESESPGVAAQVFSAMFRICNVFERILVEVYAEKAVSLELAKSISRQHRQWTEELPRMLMVDRLEESDSGHESEASPGGLEISCRHGSSNVTMAYYFSITLLTRPFLNFQVRQASRKETQATDCSSTKAGLAAFSDACVNSAVKAIDVAYEYVFEMNTSKRQPMVINSVFISSLSLGLASLDDCSRRKWPVDPSLNRAIKILDHLGQLCSQAARYAGICRQMKEAAAIYAMRRDDTLLQENDQMVRNIFGDIGAVSKGQSHGGSTTNAETMRWSMATEEGIGELMTPPPFDFSTIHEESMLPTSGMLPGQVASLAHNHDHFDSGVGGPPYPPPFGNALDSLSGFFLDPDIPLFPLTSHVSPGSYFDPNHHC